MKKILLTVLFSSVIVFGQPELSKIASMPGAFSRMGFGARGIGMANAMSAVTEGNLVSYYNPAVIVFQERNSFQTSYSVLSFDRSLNFLNFTRKFDFYSNKDTSADRKPRSTAGVSLGIINAGVSNIDGRDNNGLQTGELNTTENQFFLSVANKFSEKFSLGVGIKFYYYRLYDKIHTSGLGLDIGALYRASNNLNISFMFSDLNSKYKWDTSPLYGAEGGTTTEDKFPLLKKLGASYNFRDYKLIVSAEYEGSNGGTNIIRAGAEYNMIENFYLRAGIDNFNLSNTDYPVRPAAGFSYFKSIGSIVIGVDYAFMFEQYSSHDRHIVGININF